MPIIRSAKKKMRQDRVRTKRNSTIKLKIKNLLKTSRRLPNPKNFQQIQSVLDKAVKTKLIHKNKASRLKSRLSKAISYQLKTSTNKSMAKSKSKKVQEN